MHIKSGREYKKLKRKSDSMARKKRTIQEAQLFVAVLVGIVVISGVYYGLMASVKTTGQLIVEIGTFLLVCFILLFILYSATKKKKR